VTAVSGSRRHIGRYVMGGHAALVYIFFYAPIMLLVIFSFSGDKLVGRWGGFTFDWYREFWNNEQLADSIWVSLRVAAVSTVVSVVLGTLAALSLERFKFRGQRVFDALLYLPIIIPDVTMGIMMLVFFAEGIELLDNVLGIQLSKGIATITVSHIAFNISFVSVVVRARLAGMDQRLEEAAMDLYATRWKTFRYITLPQILPGVVGGGLLALTLSLDDVVVTQFAAGPGATTLPVFVFSLIRKGVTPMINAVSVVMLVASLVLVGLSLLIEHFRPDGPVGTGKT
jgi:spermidine/putrescine transport system permease protein